EREKEESERDAVDADVVAGADGRDPARIYLELHGSGVEVERRGHADADEEGNHREDAGHEVRNVAARPLLGQSHQNKRAHERQEDGERDAPGLEIDHLSPPMSTATTMTRPRNSPTAYR